MIAYLFIVLLAGIAYTSLLKQYARLWNALPEKNTQNRAQWQAKSNVSLLIPFRNEVNNLDALICTLSELTLDNSKLQILFINDHSTDGAEEIIQNYEGPLNIELLELTDTTGKKAAIRKGWEHCNGEIILQTDADCLLPKRWLQAMLAPFAEDKTLLACGPVKFTSPKNFWQRIVALDFTALIAIGAAHISWGKPLICNAANLAYRTKLVSGGVALNDKRASGDDVFLLQSAFQKQPDGIAFVKNINALVETAGPASFSAFWNQRLRWASKNGEYDIPYNKWILVGIWLYNLLIVLSFLTFSAVGATAAAFLILIKVLAEDTFYSSFSDFFSLQTWSKNILLGQPFHILYMAILPPLSQCIKYQWKERTIKK